MINNLLALSMDKSVAIYGSNREAEEGNAYEHSSIFSLIY